MQTSNYDDNRYYGLNIYVQLWLGHLWLKSVFCKSFSNKDKYWFNSKFENVSVNCIYRCGENNSIGYCRIQSWKILKIIQFFKHKTILFN